MLAHSIKDVLELVPEALPLVKQASVAEDYPLDSVDSCLASALTMKYHEHIDHQSVDPEQFVKVAHAVKVYGIEDKVEELAGKMIKAASDASRQAFESKNAPAEYMIKEAGFVGNLTGFVDYVALSAQAEDLLKEAQALDIEACDEVRIHAADGMLNKQGAIQGLADRYQATQNVNFVKIASAIGRLDELSLKPETLKDICSTVTLMDKEAGLHANGFNFYRDAVMLKTAATATQIQILNKAYPYESVMKLCPDEMGRYIGKDVSDECEKGPANAKAVIETLPMDLQKVLANLLKNV